MTRDNPGPCKCRDCGAEYVVNEEFDAYMYAPYHYPRDGHGYCLVCFLDVGPERRRLFPSGHG
jgi:hypothetical protein